MIDDDRCMQNTAKHGEEKELESENGWKWSETFAVHHRENSSALAKGIRPRAVFDIRNPRSTERTAQGPPKSQVKCTTCTKLSNKTTCDSIVVSWYPWPPLCFYKHLQALSVRFPIVSQGMSNIITILFQHASNIGPVKIHHAGTQKHHNDTTKMKKKNCAQQKKKAAPKKKEEQTANCANEHIPLPPPSPHSLVPRPRSKTFDTAGPSGWQTRWQQRCLWEKKKEKRKRRKTEKNNQ